MTRTSVSYRPHLFESNRALKKLLLNKIIINQTNYILSDTEIETLALGLNFTPVKKLVRNAEINNTAEALTRWTRSIDTSLFFSNQQPPNKTTRGYLQKDFATNWQPPSGDWRHDTITLDMIQTLINNTPVHRHTKLNHTSILDAIQRLSSQEEIHILKADKGNCTVLWDKQDYNREALRQLNDSNTYRELSPTEYHQKLVDLFQEGNHIAEGLHHIGCIAGNEYSNILPKEAVGSCVYFPPKVHKRMNETSHTFAGRPIVATHSCTLHWLDKYITTVTAPLLERIPGSLRDTTDFIRKLPEMDTSHNTSTNNIVIMTADVESLYPSIPWDDGIEYATRFYSDNIRFLHEHAIKENLVRPPPVQFFRAILTLVIKHSYIHFKHERYFHQIKGTAMGVCISVYFANTYMYYVTKPLLDNPPIHLLCFLRYIDDLFFIISKNETTATDIICDRMLSLISNDSIRYTHSELATHGNFLDTTIVIENNNTLVVKPYTKPTASGTYLSPYSGHPDATIKSIPFAQLVRIRRICSREEDYIQYAKILIRRFCLLGYKRSALTRLTHKVQAMDRQNLLQSRPITENGNNKNKFKIIQSYTPTIDWRTYRSSVRRIFNRITGHYPAQSAERRLLESSSSMFVFCNRKSLGHHLTRNFKNPLINKAA